MVQEDTIEFEVPVETVYVDEYGRELVPPAQGKSAPKQKTKTATKTVGETQTGKKKKYNWAFFLASFFIGMAFTTVSDSPLPMFIGMGIGFLFFVDPIYQRVLGIFQKD